jgi:hypothetical protein
MIAAGISEKSVRAHFDPGMVHVDGEQVTDPDTEA